MHFKLKISHHSSSAARNSKTWCKRTLLGYEHFVLGRLRCIVIVRTVGVRRGRDAVQDRHGRCNGETRGNLSPEGFLFWCRRKVLAALAVHEGLSVIHLKIWPVWKWQKAHFGHKGGHWTRPKRQLFSFHWRTWAKRAITFIDSVSHQKWDKLSWFLSAIIQSELFLPASLKKLSPLSTFSSVSLSTAGRRRSSTMAGDTAAYNMLLLVDCRASPGVSINTLMAGPAYSVLRGQFLARIVNAFLRPKLQHSLSCGYEREILHFEWLRLHPCSCHGWLTLYYGLLRLGFQVNQDLAPVMRVLVGQTVGMLDNDFSHQWRDNKLLQHSHGAMI